MFDGLIDKYIQEFHQKGEVVVQSIVNCSVPSQVILMKYKTLPPIESLPEKEKSEMWGHVKQVFPDKTKDQLMDACKIYYTIGTLL